MEVVLIFLSESSTISRLLKKGSLYCFPCALKTLQIAIKSPLKSASCTIGTDRRFYSVHANASFALKPAKTRHGTASA
jgi:hypothetical protein